MTQTLEQQRAADAWRCAEGRTESYTKLAKGLPVLIMNSGLMQTLAFLEAKRNGHHAELSGHLRRWLAGRFPQEIGQQKSEFAPFMQALMEAKPQAFQQITAEALAWLRWVRQIAPAVESPQPERYQEV